MTRPTQQPTKEYAISLEQSPYQKAQALKRNKQPVANPQPASPAVPPQQKMIKWTSAIYNPEHPERVKPIPNASNKFVFFSLQKNDFASKKSYKAFKTAAYEKGLVGPTNQQGIVRCAVIARDCRTNKQFFATVKVKLRGSEGNGRVFGEEETTYSEGKKQTLYHFRGYKQHTH